MTRASLARLERAMARLTCRHCGGALTEPVRRSEPPLAPEDAAELERLTAGAMTRCACGRVSLDPGRMSEADRGALRALLARLCDGHPPDAGGAPGPTAGGTKSAPNPLPNDPRA